MINQPTSRYRLILGGEKKKKKERNENIGNEHWKNENLKYANQWNN